MRNFRLQLFVAFGCGLLLGGVADAQAVQWRKLGDTPGFPGLQSELQSIVNGRPGPRIATFCVVLRDAGDRAPLVYALWPAAHLLYRWGATRDPQLSGATLLLHEPLDLRKDVIRTRSDRLSTYKVSRAWVADAKAQCKAHGEPVRIVRGAR